MGMARRRTRTRWLAPAAAVAALALTARPVRKKHAVVSKVRPELRSTALYLPMDIANRPALRVARKLIDLAPVTHRPGITSTTRTAPGDSGDPDVGVVTYERADRVGPSPALVWIHGGGTVLGGPTASQEFCSRVADELDLLVISVDYRLAPEHPFPAALHDCDAALRWLHDEAETLGVDIARIAVGGDSAGGGLAAALTQLVRDRGAPPIAFQLLAYPMLDDRTVLRAEAEGLDALFWTPASNRFAWTAYLGHDPSLDPEPPYAAAARHEDLSGLPPAWIGVGDIELFHDEDVDYARRLTEAGVPCELHVEPGMYHAADLVRAGVPSMRAFRDRMVGALAEALDRVTRGAGSHGQRPAGS